MGEISAIGLGCSRVGSFNNQTPIDEVRATLRAALDLGVTVFDTANVYGQGDSEREIGRAIADRRDQAYVVTKLGKVFSAKMRLMAFAKPLAKALLPRKTLAETVTTRRSSEIGTDFSAAAVAPNVEASLKRLKVERIDALLLHSPAAATVRDPELAVALDRVRREGKIAAFGVSCDDIGCLRAALDMPGVTLLQLPVDLIEQAKAEGLSARWMDQGVKVFAREVLRLRPQGTSPAEAIARSCADPTVACTIVGASKRQHLAEAVQACSS